MKKAIKVVGIVWGILLILGIVASFVLAAVYLGASPEAIHQAAQQSHITDQEATQILQAAGILLVFGGICSIAGAVFCFLHVALVNKDSLSKKAGIALGILGIVFGATPTGIMFLIDSIKTRS